ncbi:PIN domain-containing protein [Bradyrhizobium australafricanum]|uniref:PIN domain-containing protein n=1 Tax=Bradyrhizobium australafricanum TaxID=2821406 RepID=UPI001CE286C0|nr:PIN domain-containing protein [Bradyrhizobium australafricanum]MCA6101604.1 hypothetical protein [Bradyrhizobium australafricanum]
MELHLVPDTNLFFEFKALENLPWEELGHDPIVLLLTKPVLDEIDRHKKGGGRTRDRALDIFGRFRSMLETGLSNSEIRASGPKVILRRATAVLPDPDLKDHLDYDRADDRLIGIVSALKKQAGNHGLKLFTDDGGPAGMALDLGVPYAMIPQTWRRPATETTEAKQIRELKKDLAAYRDQEPKIKIRCATTGADGLVKAIGKAANPLTETEIADLVEALRLKHPLRADFTPPEATTTTDASGETKRVEYSAPSDEEIAKYRNEVYPKWLDDCRGVLRSLHMGRDVEAPPVVLRWVMSNDGSRPAERVRVEFETGGKLALMRPRGGTDDVDGDEDDGDRPSTSSTPEPSPRLPPAPKPPAFGRRVTILSSPVKPVPTRGFDLATIRGTDPFAGYASALSATEELGMMGQSPFATSDAMRRIQESINGVTRFDALMRPGFDPAAAISRFEPIPSVPVHQFLIPEEPAPEEFYYASWPADEPVPKGSLTCQLWRHQSGDEFFEFKVLFGEAGDVRGVVQCTVHADNLTVPAQAKVIVGRKIEPLGMFDLAKAMVDASS